MSTRSRCCEPRHEPGPAGPDQRGAGWGHPQGRFAPASRRPAAVLDGGPTRHRREIRPGRGNGPFQPNKETSLASWNSAFAQLDGHNSAVGTTGRLTPPPGSSGPLRETLDCRPVRDSGGELDHLSHDWSVNPTPPTGSAASRSISRRWARARTPRSGLKSDRAKRPWRAGSLVRCRHGCR